MKRLFSILLVCIILFSTTPFHAHATNVNSQAEYFDDGSYLIVEVDVHSTRMLTKVGNKTATYYSADNEIQWKMFITGEFLYDGATVTCTYASGTTTIYKTSLWRKVSDNTVYSGNTATYTTTFDSLFMGVTVEQGSYSLHITCDENGNIS